MSERKLSMPPIRERIQRLLLRLPPVKRVDEGLHRVEHEVLQRLKLRLEALGDERVAADGNGLNQLLEQSIEQDQEQAWKILVHRVLSPLTPDEARILAAVSDGSAFPMLTLYSGGRWLGRGTVLHRYSNVGRASGVQCNGMVPLYLSRLHNSGLIVGVPETLSMKTDYELCEGDADFRRARETLTSHCPHLKMVRQTLVISPVGRQLWDGVMDNNNEE